MKLTKSEALALIIFAVLIVAFIALRIAHFITWSWWWLLLPFGVFVAIIAAGVWIGSPNPPKK